MDGAKGVKFCPGRPGSDPFGPLGRSSPDKDLKKHRQGTKKDPKCSQLGPKDTKKEPKCSPRGPYIGTWPGGLREAIK